MEALRIISREQIAYLRKSVTDDEHNMNLLRRLIFFIIQDTMDLVNLDPGKKHINLRKMYLDLYKERPAASMKPSNITTYYWLFGFKNLARNYILIDDTYVYNFKNRPNITSYHIYCLYLSLSALGLINNLAFPICSDDDGKPNDRAVITFLKNVHSQILSGIKKSKRTKNANCRRVYYNSIVNEVHISTSFKKTIES